MSQDNLISIRDVKTHYFLSEGTVKAVDGVSLQMARGEALGLVGESGCGKSTLALSTIGLIPPPGKIVEGSILFDGVDLLKLSEAEMQSNIRGNKISMIFQDPSSSLNPLFTIEDQICEAILLHRNVSKDEAKVIAVDLLEKIAMPDAKERLRNYPHQLSGGMRQRVMFAIALSCDPMLIIADEPTSNLDVTIQGQMIELMKDMQKEFNTAVLLITHDLGVVSELSDNIAVMYCGKVAEYSDKYSVLTQPIHPYTTALLKSFPTPEKKVDRLAVIKGNVPNMLNLPQGCKFHPRCDYALERCRNGEPSLIEVEKGHFVACYQYES